MHKVVSIKAIEKIKPTWHAVYFTRRRLLYLCKQGWSKNGCNDMPTYDTYQSSDTWGIDTEIYIGAIKYIQPGHFK